MYTSWPTIEQMDELFAVTPWSMHPNRDPLAVILEGYLKMSECDDIIAASKTIESHNFPGCRSTETHEFSTSYLPYSFDSAVDIIRGVNRRTWDFILDPQPYAWMQTYDAGASYDLHTDSAPGQSRKLSAVIQLSGKGLYTGGDLELLANGQILRAPRLGGSIIIFQSWVQHRVTPVTSGSRQSVNLGFYGPKFR